MELNFIEPPSFGEICITKWLFPEPESPGLDPRNGGFHGRTGGGNAKSKILLSMYQLGEYISAHTHCFTIRFPFTIYAKKKNSRNREFF